MTIGADWKAAFGDSPEPADELAVLVLFGIKTATCWAVSDGASTHVGKRMVVWFVDRERASGGHRDSRAYATLYGTHHILATRR